MRMYGGKGEGMFVRKVGGREDMCELGGGRGWVLRLMLGLGFGDMVLYGG